MAFFDSAKSSLDKMSASADRKSKIRSLKNLLSSAQKQKAELMTALGNSIYIDVKDDPAFRNGREDLFDSLARCIEEEENYSRQIDELEREPEQTPGTGQVICRACGTQVSAGDMFCWSCGAEVPKYKPQNSSASGSRICPNCGRPASETDRFCMGCGTPIPEDEPQPDAFASTERNCPNCGCTASPDDMFCMVCGTKLDS